MHKKVPADEIKAAVEECINSVVLNEARNEYADMPVATSKSEERLRKTALFDKVGNIANRKCDTVFRDKVKRTYNKLIASAKSLCSTRVNRAFHATINRLQKDDTIKICKYDKGVGLVVLDTDEYYTKLDVIVNDTTKFKKLEIDGGKSTR